MFYSLMSSMWEWPLTLQSFMPPPSQPFCIHSQTANMYYNNNRNEKMQTWYPCFIFFHCTKNVWRSCQSKHRNECIFSHLLCCINQGQRAIWSMPGMYIWEWFKHTSSAYMNGSLSSFTWEINRWVKSTLREASISLRTGEEELTYLGSDLVAVPLHQ